MRTSHWLSGWYARLDRRERRVVAGGAILSAVALITVYGVLPFARRWSEREARIAALAEQAGRLEALVESQSALDRVVAELDRSRERRDRRLLLGQTADLAASSLQSLVKGYADRSRVRLERVDVVRDLESESSGLTPVGLRLTVRGDVYGLVDFLFYLQNGEKLLVLDELRVTASGRAATRASAGAELLSWSVRLHAFHATAEDAA